MVWFSPHLLCILLLLNATCLRLPGRNLLGDADKIVESIQTEQTPAIGQCDTHGPCDPSVLALRNPARCSLRNILNGALWNE